MLGITMTASGFSGAANVLASPISPQWATGGTARRGASRSYALGSNGARTVPPTECSRQGFALVGCGGPEVADHGHLRLLRPRRKRPRCRNATNKAINSRRLMAAP
jgi:hypothetical protein